MKIPAISAFFIAQAAVGDPWWTPLANFGIAGIVIAWFMYRDKRESERSDTRHQENLAASKRIEDAFRVNTTSLMVAVEGMNSMDRAYVELAAKLKSQ